MTGRLRVSDDSVVPLPVQPQYMSNITGVKHDWTSLPVGIFPPSISVIQDVVGKRGVNHPVHHWKLTSFCRRFPDWGHTFDSDLGINLAKELFFPIQTVGTYAAVQAWPWLPDMLHSAWISDSSIGAFNKFHDQIPTSVSLANSLYELKDIKGLIPSVTKGSLSKTAANNLLGFEFGVLPMVSDIKAIVEMSDKVEKRIKHLISVNGRTTSLSFDRELVQDEPFEFFRSIDSLGTSLGSDGILFKRQSVRTKLHIGGKLSQDLRDLADANAKLKGLIASGGFNHPARVVWNAIPYSFVVDWFFHVGKLMDTLMVQPFGGDYEVSDVWYSVKSDVTYIAIAHNNSEDTYPILGNPVIGTVHVSVYDRLPGFPVSSLFLTDGILSPTQQVLALAMLEQKRR